MHSCIKLALVDQQHSKAIKNLLWVDSKLRFLVKGFPVVYYISLYMVLLKTTGWGGPYMHQMEAGP